MAEMYTPEEIQEIFDAYNDAIQKGVPVSKELAQQMKDAAIGVKNYTQNLKSSMDKLGTSFKTLGKDLYDGAQGADAFSGSIEAGADAVTAYTAKFGPAGRALGLFVKATASYITAVNKQADALYKSYQEVSRSGVIGAGGMQDLYVRMQDLGFGVKELSSAVAVLAENSQALADFGGTATTGAKAFAELSRDIRESQFGVSLQNMGVSVEEINRGIAGFLKQQTMLGRGQADVQKNLNSETTKYLENMEVLARLTGQDRKTMEAKIQDAQNEQAFNRRLSVLKERAAQGDMAAAKEAEKLELLNLTMEGEARKEFLAAQAGDMSRASKLLLTAPEFIQAVRDPSKSAAQALDAFAKGSKERIDSMGDLALYNAWNDSFINMTELQQFQAKYGKQAAQELIDQARIQSQVTDKGTKNETDLQIAQRKTRDNLQDFVNLGINPVTSAMATLAEVIEYLTSLIPGSGRFTKKGKAKAAVQSQVDQETMSQGGASGIATPTAELTPEERKSSMAGLRIKSSEAYAGGETSTQMLGIAQAIQAKLGSDLQYFSAFNDTYDRGGNSLHGKGRALDFTLSDPAKAAMVADMVRGIPGISKVIDEYNNPSRSATGGHIHAEIQALKGAVLSGPMSGYRPNLTMHGTEAVVPLPDGRSIPVTTTANSEQMGMMAAQLERLDELVSLMGRQVSATGKLLQYQS